MKQEREAARDTRGAKVALYFEILAKYQTTEHRDWPIRIKYFREPCFIRFVLQSGSKLFSMNVREFRFVSLYMVALIARRIRGVIGQTI